MGFASGRQPCDRRICGFGSLSHVAIRLLCTRSEHIELRTCVAWPTGTRGRGVERSTQNCVTRLPRSTCWFIPCHSLVIRRLDARKLIKLLLHLKCPACAAAFHHIVSAELQCRFEGWALLSPIACTSSTQAHHIAGEFTNLAIGGLIISYFPSRWSVGTGWEFAFIVRNLLRQGSSDKRTFPNDLLEVRP